MDSQAVDMVVGITLALTVAVGTIALLVVKHRKSGRTATVVRESIQIELNQGEVPDAVFHTGNDTCDAATVPGYEFDEVSLGELDADLDGDDVFLQATASTGTGKANQSVRPWLKLARPSWQAPPPSPARSPVPARKKGPSTSTSASSLEAPLMAPASPSLKRRASPRRSRTVTAQVHPTKHGLGLILADAPDCAGGAGGGTAIGKVVPGGPGYVAGLAAGDELTFIDGVDVSGLCVQETKQRLLMATAAARLGGRPVEVVAKRYLHASRSALEGGVRFSPPPSPATTSTKTFASISA